MGRVAGRGRRRAAERSTVELDPPALLPGLSGRLGRLVAGLRAARRRAEGGAAAAARSSAPPSAAPRGVDAAAAAVAVAATSAESERPRHARARPPRRRPGRRGARCSPRPAARALEAACREDPSLRARAARGRLCFAVPVGDRGEADRGARRGAVDSGARRRRSSSASAIPPTSGSRSTRRRGPRRAPWFASHVAAADARCSRCSPRAARRRGSRSRSGPVRSAWSRRGAPSPGSSPVARAAGGRPASRRCRPRPGAAPRRAPAARCSSAPSARRRSRRCSAIALLVIALALILARPRRRGRPRRAGCSARPTSRRSRRRARCATTSRGSSCPPRACRRVARTPRTSSKAEYLDRARAAAPRRGRAQRHRRAARRTSSFPDGGSFAPLRVDGRGARPRSRSSAPATSRGPRPTVERRPRSHRRRAPRAPRRQPAMASGGGYGGPLAYRQGERDATRRRGGVRPDGRRRCSRRRLARGQLRLPLRRRAARALGAEPRPADGRSAGNVAAPLRDRARPRPARAPTAGWRRTRGASASCSATRWEPWHYGFDAGPEPCSAEGENGGLGDGRTPTAELAGGGGLPRSCPPQYREMLIASAARHGVSAALLAAQIMAESQLQPERRLARRAPRGSPSSCRRRRPPTASTIPSIPTQAIDAQARMMAELLAQFGSVELALAAYNAGPGRGRRLRLHPALSRDAGLRRPDPGPARRRRRAGRAAGSGARGPAGGLRPAASC